jgi:uncharacterized repeat protein (TIGR01451 family)
MKRRARLLLTIVTAALVLASGGATLTISGPNLNPGRDAAELAREHRTQVQSIRTRLMAGERVSLIVRLKLSYSGAEGQRVPIAELERTKAEVIARLAGRGIESARSIPNATALQVIVTSIVGLDRVLSDPMVREIWEDRTLKLLVNQSRQIIHATAPWNDNVASTGTPYTGSGFAVAIIDTGVDSTIPVQAEACFSTPNPSLYIDTLCLPSFASTPPGVLTVPGAAAPCTGLDGCDHGTHVAGIAVGATVQPGVAPGAKVVAIQVFTNQQGALLAQTSDIVAALAYVAYYNNNKPTTANSIVSVNMSLGTPGTAAYCASGGGIAAEIVDLKKQGVTVVAASGNDGKATLIDWPACVSVQANAVYLGSPPAGVVSVGATNKWDVVATFSNAGPSSSDFHLDLLAPGAGISAVIPGGVTGIKSGTSMAAPHVAGCAVLLAEEARALAGQSNDPGAFPLNVNTPDIFESALKATGLPITDWRDYNITTPRLDCGAALWNLRGANHLATISGRKTDANNIGLAGWLIEAFSVGEPWPVGYVGHPSYSTITGPGGIYNIQVPWGVFQLGESPYGPLQSTGTDYWTQFFPSTPVTIDAKPGSMGPFPNNDFVNKKEAFCPVGQDYKVLVAGQKDHFAMGLDTAAPDLNLQTFFADRYSPHPPARMEIDENNWSNRAFIHTFDLLGPLSGGKVVTKARFDIGARPVVQPPTEDDGTYLLTTKRLERNDAVWLLFPDANGGILGNPTAWGRGIGPGSIIGPGLLTTDWDYPTQQLRYDFAFPLPMLPMPSGLGLPNYVDSDIRPMINLHRQVGLFFQDDTGIDYAAMHLCTRVPNITITKTPTGQQFNTGVLTTFDLTVTNIGATSIPSSGNTLQVSDELPDGFEFNPNSSGSLPSGNPDWSCNATVGGPGGSKFLCKYIGTGLAASTSTTIKVPVKAVIAGTHQNCVSVDVIDQSNGDILDHNSACSVNSVGYDIGARKRKSEYMIKWGNPLTPTSNDSVEFTIGVRNFGQQLSLPPGGIKLADTVPHTGFEYIPNSLGAGTDWTCGTPTLLPQPLSFACGYTGASLNPPGVVPPGFKPNPLQLERGFALPTLSFKVRGNETGWWQNCAKATLTGYTDEIAANDNWCVNVFVQGNVAVTKSTGHPNHEYVYHFGTGQSEPIDLTIDVSNLAGKIDAPLRVVVDDKLPSGFSLVDPSQFAVDNPSWNCSLVLLPIIECTYRNLPIAGAQGFPVVPVPLDPIKLNLIASKPGIYQNCAVGDIKAGPTPIDDQPDAISPPDPPPPIDTDFDRTNNKGCTIIIVGHDVRLVKSASNMTPNAGEPFTFDFQITNHLSSIGPNEQLVLTDVLPSGFTVGTLPTSGPGGWNCMLAVTCTFKTGTTIYPASVLPSLSLPVFAPTNAGPYKNCAVLDVQLQNNDEDDVPGNNDATNPNGCVTINVPGHLNVAKVSDQPEYDLGASIQFTVTVTNPATGAPGYGSVIASPVTINLSDTLPPGVTFGSANWPVAWGCSPSSLTCTPLPSVQIKQGDQFSFHINAIGSTPGHYTNCFNVALGGAANVSTAGNAPCVSFYVGHDVAISKSVDNPTPQFGATVTFTLSVSNNLSSIVPPRSIVVTDTLPSGLIPNVSWINANNPAWNCPWTPPTLTCTYIGGVPAGTAPAGSALSPINLQAKVNGWGTLNNCSSVALVNVTDDIPANNGLACAIVKAQEGYLAIYKAFVDNTGGTPVPSVYASGFPVRLSCSSFTGQITVPIKAGFFSSNDPVLTAGDPSHSMSGASPSTSPTVPGTTCLVTEAPLPPIQNVKACHGGSASWVTTISGGGSATIVAGQTAVVTGTNTLKCDQGYLAIYKVYHDQTGGTTLPTNYTTPPQGFPVGLSCPGYFSGTIPVPIAAGYFSSNDPVLTAGDPSHSMSGASPSTGRSPANIQCTVKENNGNPLPQIQTPACPHPPNTLGGPATWTTTFSPPTTPTAATVTIPVNGTAVITVTNTLTCVTQFGSLQVSKVVSNPLGIAWPSGTTFTAYVFCMHNSSTFFNGPLTIHVNASAGFSPPYGTSCTITEPTPPSPSTFTNAAGQTCIWSQVAPLSQIVIISSPATGVAVTNTFTCH